MGLEQVARAPSLLKRCPEISWGDDDRPSLISADACGRRLVLHAVQPWTLLWLKWCVAVYCCCTLLSGYLVSARQCSTLGLCSQRESGITFALSATATVRVVGSLGFMRWTEAVIGLRYTPVAMCPAAYWGRGLCWSGFGWSDWHG